MGGLVAQFHYLPTLVGEVQLRVKRTHRLVGDLQKKETHIVSVTSAAPLLAPQLRICIHTIITNHVRVFQVAHKIKHVAVQSAQLNKAKTT